MRADQPVARLGHKASFRLPGEGQCLTFVPQDLEPQGRDRFDHLLQDPGHAEGQVARGVDDAAGLIGKAAQEGHRALHSTDDAEEIRINRAHVLGIGQHHVRRVEQRVPDVAGKGSKCLGNVDRAAHSEMDKAAVRMNRIGNRHNDCSGTYGFRLVTCSGSGL